MTFRQKLDLSFIENTIKTRILSFISGRKSKYFQPHDRNIISKIVKNKNKTNKQTNKQINKQTSKQTNKQN